jgi:3-oxoadipate enol-lactonase
MQKINGLAVYDEGLKAGAPIVFVHGFPFDHTMWEPQVQALSKTFRVITYDVRGHGASEIGDGVYSIDLFVKDLIGILDALKLSKVALCGLSMGGYIALRAMEKYPQRFSRLILCDTKSVADTEEGKKKRAAAAETVKKDLVPAYAEGFSKAVLTERTVSQRPELVEVVKKMIRGNSVEGIVGTLAALAGRSDTTQALAGMAIPTLILTGSEDKITPPSDAEAMSRILPHAKLVLLPDAAHLSNLENPTLFNDKLISFLTA